MVGDDGLQLVQYEFTIFCQRTEGFARLAEWLYARYASAALEVFESAAARTGPFDIHMTDRTHVLVAAIDGLSSSMA